MESYGVCFYFAVVSYVCTKIQTWAKCNIQDNSSQMLLAHLKVEEMLFWLSLTSLNLKTVVISKQCFNINRLIKWKIFHFSVGNSSCILPAGVWFLSHVSHSFWVTLKKCDYIDMKGSNRTMKRLQ